ncbi:hypothetical protein M758_11G126900 [Ceratodon purpureus]|uniref:Uncharacterized protein n=1 Tax=Ceratodon purpureus TaxID=3225 RepID=A0A8T0GEI5_CERPU|nr:hypothetical protein KC19_11G131300 [Ceratodon purpureus]KAG0601625.1 hypothetical protein M758_11G126900 [Ceratodon purpureus]
MHVSEKCMTVWCTSCLCFLFQTTGSWNRISKYCTALALYLLAGTNNQKCT